MALIPNCFLSWHCIAGACRHNCCLDWEIGVDPAALARYEAIKGPLGDRLRAGILREGEPCFRLTAEGRCPMLDGDNLCAIQRELGEAALPRICRDHPRYRVFLPGRIEEGIGLACEEGARLLLRERRPLRLVGAVDGPPTRESAALLIQRQRLLDAAQDRRFSPGGRLRRVLLLSGASLPRRTRREWCAFFLSMEALDPLWESAWRVLEETRPDWAGFAAHMHGRETEYEQLLVYFLLRHLLADDGRELSARAGFAVLSTAMLYALGAARFTSSGGFSPADQVELSRLYSANIEYSGENMRKILG